MEIYKRVPYKGISIHEAWKLQQPTPVEVEEAKQQYNEDVVCEHFFVTITSGWIYDTCDCAICDKFVCMI
jgi:hypothetical protein